MQEWRCEKCNKVKDLRGPHLSGKVSVRSDCWPCAKKTTFKLVGSNSAASAVDPVADTKKNGASPDKVGPASTVPPAPFLFSTPPAVPAAAKPAPFGTSTSSVSTPFQFGGGKTGNPFASTAAAPAAPPTVQQQPPLVNPFLNFSSNVTAAPSTAQSTSGIVMQQPVSALGKGPNPSPPFSFVAASKSSAAPVPPVALGPSTMSAFAASLTAAPTSAKPTGEPTWKCVTCGKVKDLRGAHLNGKTTVRSDCWPCAKKRTFVLYDADGKALGQVEAKSSPAAPSAAEKSVVPSSVASPLSTDLHSSSVKSPQSSLVPQTPAAQSTADTLVTCSSFDATPIQPYDPKKRVSGFAWREPDIPSPVVVRNFFIESLSRPPQPTSAPSTDFSLSLVFYEKMVRSYMQGRRSHRFERSVPVTWDAKRSIMYVLCTDFASPHTLNAPLSTLAEGLGDFASLLMHVDSTVQNIGRVFCSDAYALAAAALYQTHVNASIKVFGPAGDKTSQPTPLEEVIRILDVQPRVTSGEVRNEAVKKLWGNYGISVMPSAAVAEAIRCVEIPSSDDGVDVVLLTKSATPDDYSHFRLLIA